MKYEKHPKQPTDRPTTSQPIDHNRRTDEWNCDVHVPIEILIFLNFYKHCYCLFFKNWDSIFFLLIQLKRPGKLLEGEEQQWMFHTTLICELCTYMFLHTSIRYNLSMTTWCLQRWTGFCFHDVTMTLRLVVGIWRLLSNAK